MNPKVREHWEKASAALRAAKNHLENGENSEIVKKDLYIAIFYGHLAIKETPENIGLCSASTAIEALGDIEHVGDRQAIERTRKALNEYRNLVSDEYYLPELTF